MVISNLKSLIHKNLLSKSRLLLFSIGISFYTLLSSLDGHFFVRLFLSVFPSLSFSGINQRRDAPFRLKQLDSQLR